MTTLVSELRPIKIIPGVEPGTDKTALSTVHYTSASGIRFSDGYPQKMAGNYIFHFNNDETVSGKARTLYSAQLDQVETIIGTNEKLYSVQGTLLTNITPLEATTVAIANSLDTDFATLAADPFETTLGSRTVTVTDPNTPNYVAGDTVEYAGAAGFAGIPAGEFNTTHIIRSVVDATHYTISVSTAATSATTGGGAAVDRATGRITVNAAAHGQENGDRVKITGAADTGGILAADINLEFVIRNVTVNTFDIFTDGIATSAVTAGGGAATEYQDEIPAGAENESFGQGYGLGLYGVGLYGTSKTSISGRSYPRIWFPDRFASTIFLTPGNQGGIYEWDGNENTAPALLAGAPATANYIFVSDNILVTFGYNGVPNQIFSSAQGDPSNFVASSTNAVFQDSVEGAGRLTSHVNVNGTNLIFTENQVYTMRFIGLPLVWDIEVLDPNIGLIGPMARCTVKGAAFWIGQHNFYMWDGGVVKIIPANTQPQSTILNYIFKDLNTGQKSKCFAWYNPVADEVWFHIPSAASNEPDTVARVSLQDYSWVPDDMDRLAAEYPNILLVNPRMMDLQSRMRVQEVGTDDDTEALAFSLISNFQAMGKKTAGLVGFIPDSNQTGNITVGLTGKQYPQSAQSQTGSYTVTPTTERVPTQINARYVQYEWSGNALGQSWQMGNWTDYVQGGPTQ